MSISEKDLICDQLRWAQVYYSELTIAAPVVPNDQTTLLWKRINHHMHVHTALLFDALILTLYNLLDTPGWDQKNRNSEKLTLEHFVKRLPCLSQQRQEAERFLQETRSLSAFRDLRKARNNFIAHPNLDMHTSYTTPEQTFCNLTLADFHHLLEGVRKVALVAVDEQMDFSTPGFDGIEKLIRILRPTSGEI